MYGRTQATLLVAVGVVFRARLTPRSTSIG
jgi:hypothetical protein